MGTDSRRGLKGKGRETALRLFEPDDIQQTLQHCTVRGKLTISPLYYWEDSDLWDFIKDRKLRYCKLYSEGFERLGCVGCPMGRHKGRVRDFERWPKFRDMYIRSIERLKTSGFFSNYTTAESVMEWWLSDKTQDKPI